MSSPDSHDRNAANRPPVQTACRIVLFLIVGLAQTWSAQSDSQPAETSRVQAITGELAVSRLVVPEEVSPDGFFNYENAAVPWEMRLERSFGDTEIWHVTFPSPLVTPIEENNTVHAELHIPAGDGPFPGAVVLHILDGRLNVSRLVASDFAAHGIAALIVIMPGYRERRRDGDPRGFVSEDIDRLTQGVRQAVMDAARAGEWLRAFPRVQQDNVSLVGVSLGGFVCAGTAALDHRFNRAAIVLAGGGLADVLLADSPETQAATERLLAAGHTREGLREKLARIDPLTYAPHMGADRALLINADEDEVVPRESSLALARAIGTERHLWYSGTHVGVILHIVDILAQSRRFLFGEEYLVPQSGKTATPPS